MDKSIVTKMYNVVSREPSIYTNGRTIACFINNSFPPIWALNSTKTHPVQAKNAKHPEAIRLHAEVAAYITARKIFNSRDFERSSLYIMRVHKKPSTKELVIAMAKPCTGCAGLIRELRVRKVFYSNDEGVMVRL
jgi:deoxycytidylate deaminase